MISQKSFYFIRKFCVALFFFSFIFVVNSAIIAQQTKGKIIVNVYGFKNNKGQARLLIFSSKEKDAFPKEKDKALGKYLAVIKDNKVTFILDNLPYGDYAISVHHDEDNNGKVNTNFFGIPNEGLGSSNDAKGVFGPPSFDKAKITLNKSELYNNINIVN